MIPFGSLIGVRRGCHDFWRSTLGGSLLRQIRASPRPEALIPGVPAVRHTAHPVQAWLLVLNDEWPPELLGRLTCRDHRGAPEISTYKLRCADIRANTALNVGVKNA